MSSSLSGLLLIDKPAGITSFDCIRELRRRTGIRKIGHAGTLDPMATGLMLLLIGSATKQASRFSRLDKSYAGELTLGHTSLTGDSEGELNPVSSKVPSFESVSSALKSLEGELVQTPPAYSAVKVGGVRAYRLARAGKPVSMPPRSVTVKSIELLEYAYPRVSFKAEVSSGTYIRSLAVDIGQRLQTGGYLNRLRRLSIGEHRLEDALRLEDITAQTLPQYLINI